MVLGTTIILEAVFNREKIVLVMVYIKKCSLGTNPQDI